MAKHIAQKSQKNRRKHNDVARLKTGRTNEDMPDMEPRNVAELH